MLLHNQYEFNPATDLIGKGGFSEVFKAFDHNLQKTVAIKRFIKDPGSKGSVLKEIQSSIDYSHTNIIRYYNCFTQEYKDHLGRTITEEYGVMEYANAGSLSDIINGKRKVSDETFKNIILGILDGLHYLHTLPSPVIHRDLKPGNILLQEQNGHLIPKICDFGISKEWQDVTKSGTMTSAVGTMEYMAPEQLADRGIQPATDLWALGCIIIEYFCGQPPFGKVSSGTSVPALNTNILNVTYSSTQLNKIPEPFKALVKACLVKDVKTRVRSAEEGIAILLERSKPTTPSKPFNLKALFVSGALIVGVSLAVKLFLSADFDKSEFQSWEENLLIEESEFNNSVSQDKNWVYKYNSIKPLTAEIIAVELDGKWGLVDKHGNEFTSLKYSGIKPFSNGLASVNDNNRWWGLIDTLGREVIPLKYEVINTFSEGIAAVNLGMFKHGFVD